MTSVEIDILCVGELLIDLIGQSKNSDLENTDKFQKFLGGSPTNVAVNAASLGLKSALIACCGDDGFGNFLLNELEKKNVDCSFVQKSDSFPTSIITVSNSDGTPDFSAYRGADFQIKDFENKKIIERSKVFHTTCFALSKNPARSSILKGAALANSLGLILSIDLNFSDKIWSDRKQAHAVVEQYLSNQPLVKISDDDCLRYFGTKLSDQAIFDYFHEKGAQIICFTKGKNGVLVSSKESSLIKKPALEIKDVVDTTGAGDAFWTGFLNAQLNSQSLEDSIDQGQRLAAIKIQNIGALPVLNDLF